MTPFFGSKVETTRKKDVIRLNDLLKLPKEKLPENKPIDIFDNEETQNLLYQFKEAFKYVTDVDFIQTKAPYLTQM